MLTDLQIQRLKTEQGKAKRHADRDGLVLEVRASGKKVLQKSSIWQKISVSWCISISYCPWSGKYGMLMYSCSISHT